ncbi:phosphatase PAP2 family protein [Streptomyces sp. NPDC005828]|uniref:phosphatase PAP2 family protein n=1 Tax=Streptomyces sp. NPDC005828 TaxID=3157071 RepID=UPI0033EA5E6E
MITTKHAPYVARRRSRRRPRPSTQSWVRSFTPVWLSTFSRTPTTPGPRCGTSGTACPATWLEVHGKKDVWKVYAKDQRELLSKTTGSADKAQLKAAMALANALTKTLAAQYDAPAPYVLDPSLRTDKKVTPGQTCPCSYPSKHAALSATAVTLLSAGSPRRAAEYRWMDSEVAYSRLYMAGHVRGDILAGALLGDLVADYTLITAGLPLPAATAGPTGPAATPSATTKAPATSSVTP